MLIRLAKPHDLDAIVACQSIAFDLPSTPTPARDANQAGELTEQLGKRGIHVIGSGSSILGYISFAPHFDHLFVNAIAVLPPHRNHGLGSQLLTFAERHAAKLGIHRVSLFTDGNANDNISFYQSRGYRETDRCEDGDFSRIFFSKFIEPSTRGECSMQGAL